MYSVASTISRSNRNRLIMSVLGFIALLAFVFFSYRYFYNFFAGPFEANRAEILTATTPDDLLRRYVTVDGDNVADTGFQRETTRNGRVTSTDNYLALKLDDRFLLVETPKLGIGTTYTGYLEPLPADVRDEIIGDIEREDPSLKGIFLPMILRDDNVKFPGYLGLVAATVLFGLSSWGLVTFAIRASDPSYHPITRALSRFGNPSQAMGEIDSEMMLDHPQVGDLHFTPNWLIQTRGAHMDATRLDDIVWVYKKVTQRRVNGVPAGKTYSAQIHDRHGAGFLVQAKEPLVDQTLLGVLQRRPWVITGHSAELETTWKRNRADLVSAVDQRRQQALAAANS